MVMDEDTLTTEDFLNAIDTLFKNRDSYIQAMNACPQSDAIQTILDLIEEVTK